MNLRILIYPVKGRRSTSYKAEVKGPGVRTFVGTLPSHAEAEAAARHFITTGERPPAAKRGPKGPRKPRTPREFQKWGPTPTPDKADRLELMRKLAERWVA